MMSSAGHVMAMIKSMRDNRELLKKRTSLFRGLNKKISSSYRNLTKEQKQMSKEELSALRQKLIRQNRLVYLKQVFAFVLALIIVGLLIYWANQKLDLKDFFV